MDALRYILVFLPATASKGTPGSAPTWSAANGNLVADLAGFAAGVGLVPVTEIV